jgi:ABC-type multidrug transport system permease subunit
MLPFFPVEIFFLLLGTVFLTPLVFVLLLKAAVVFKFRNNALNVACYFFSYVVIFVITTLIVRSIKTGVLEGLIAFNIMAAIGLFINFRLKNKKKKE